MQHVTWHGVFGMETTGYKGTITADAVIQGNRLDSGKAEQTELVREKEGRSVKVSLRGDGEDYNRIYLPPLYGISTDQWSEKLERPADGYGG